MQHGLPRHAVRQSGGGAFNRHRVVCHRVVRVGYSDSVWRARLWTLVYCAPRAYRYAQARVFGASAVFNWRLERVLGAAWVLFLAASFSMEHLWL